MVGVGVWTTSGDALNTRGVTAPGRLEAYWKLDESSGRVAEDASGKQLNGRFNKEPNRVSGVAGRAVRFDGANDYIDFGHATALRLAGSMTISAWVNSMSFPVDDAAIVSSHNNSTMVAGYQLDTTVDTGPRTIGFKIGDECGRLTARYGATPLRVGTWYHVAGVYDADTHVGRILERPTRQRLPSRLGDRRTAQFPLACLRWQTERSQRIRVRRLHR